SDSFEVGYNRPWRTRWDSAVTFRLCSAGSPLPPFTPPTRSCPCWRWGCSTAFSCCASVPWPRAWPPTPSTTRSRSGSRIDRLPGEAAAHAVTLEQAAEIRAIHAGAACGLAEVAAALLQHLIQVAALEAVAGFVERQIGRGAQS